MTSSHLQFFKIGPVAPVAKKMGVSNIRLLHREHNPNYNNQLKTARRSLWGSPEPGEIKKLSNERAQSDRDYMIKRYSYDIFAEKFVNETEGLDDESNNNNQQNNNNNNNKIINNNKISINNSNKHIDNSYSFKDTLEQQQNVIERLSGPEQTENHNCNKSVISNELCNNEINVPTGIITKPVITKIMPTTPSGILLKDKKSCERIKPYSTKKQNLITEYFPTRKTIHTSEAPVPQKAKLLDNETLCELKQQQQQQQQKEQESLNV